MPDDAELYKETEYLKSNIDCCYKSFRLYDLKLQ